MGELRGVQQNPRDIARWCYHAGPLWQNAIVLTEAVAVCLSESQGFDKAINWNYKKGPDGSYVLDEKGEKVVDSEDHGMWQLNLKTFPSVTVELAQDPKRATKFAYSIYRNWGNFNAWYGYRNKVYLRDTYLKKAVRGVGNFLAEIELERQKKHLPDYQTKLTIPLLYYNA